jgi:phage-related protein
MKVAGDVGDSLVSAARTGAESVGEMVGTVVDTLKEGGGLAMEAIQDSLGSALESVGLSFEDLGGAADWLSSALRESIGKIFTTEKDRAKERGVSGRPDAGGAAAVPGIADPLVDGISMAVGELTEKIRLGVGNIGDAFGVASTTVLNAFEGAAGEMVSAAQEGFAEGGIFGAIFNVLAKFATKTKGFGEMMDIMNEDLEGLTKAISPMTEIFKDLTKVVSGSVQRVFTQLGKAFKALAKGFGPFMQSIGTVFRAINGVIEVFLKVLTPILQVFGYVLQGVGFVLEGLAKGFVAIFNWVVEVFAKIASVVGKGDDVRKLKINLDDVSRSSERVADSFKTLTATFEDGSQVSQEFAQFLSGPAKQLKKDLAALTAAGVEITEELFEGMTKKLGGAVEEVADALDDDGGLGDKMGDVGDKMEIFGDTIAETNRELSNVPKGFKVALAEFEAAGVGPAGGMLLSDLDMDEDSAIGRTTNIYIGNVDTTDPQGFLQMLKEAEERFNYDDTGTSFPSGAPYSVPDRGA